MNRQMEFDLSQKLLPQRVTRGISKIARLDVKEKKHSDEADDIAYSMPYGQPPPVYGRTLDKTIKVQAQKAAIWNEIRNILVETAYTGIKRTLWQIALNAPLPACFSGVEHHLDFGAEEINEAIDCFRFPSL